MAQDRKEKLNPRQLVFLDADKTLWKVESQSGDDWASKVPNPTFVLEDKGVVLRDQDSTRFILKEGVSDCLERLSKEGIGIGIISDNIYKDVMTIAQMLNIWKFFDESLVNIRLWKGPCPKELMITEVLQDNNLQSTKILMVDDKDYSEAMAVAGYHFLLSPKDSFPSSLILEYFKLKPTI